MDQQVVINKYFLQATRVLSIVSTLGVIAVEAKAFCEQFTQHAKSIHTSLLSTQLMVLSLLLLLGHIGKPRILIQQFHFVSSYFGRGLLEVWVGCSVMLLAIDTGSILPAIFGGCATGTGLIKIFFSCPCFSVVEDRPRQMEKDDFEHGLNEKHEGVYKSTADASTVPLTTNQVEDPDRELIVGSDESAYEVVDRNRGPSSTNMFQMRPTSNQTIETDENQTLLNKGYPNAELPNNQENSNNHKGKRKAGKKKKKSIENENNHNTSGKSESSNPFA